MVTSEAAMTRDRTYVRSGAASSDARPDAELLDLAEALIEKKAAPFDPKEFHDRYVDALHELIARKRKSKSNRKIIEEKDEPSGRGAANVVDLMAALKKSIEKPKAKPAQKRSTTTTRAAGKKKSPARTAPKKAAAKKRA